MVAGHDDDDHRHDRVGQRDPAPAAGRGDDDRDADDRRPRDVYRRHRRELRGSRLAERGIHRLSEPGRRVDDAQRGDEPRRRDRDELDRQAPQRCERDDVADGRVVVAVAEPEPHQEDPHRRDVHRRVEDVAAPAPGSSCGETGSAGPLVREVQRAFEIPDVLAGRDRVVDLQDRDRADDAPQRVEHEHDRELDREGCEPFERALARRPRRDTRGSRRRHPPRPRCSTAAIRGSRRELTVHGGDRGPSRRGCCAAPRSSHRRSSAHARTGIRSASRRGRVRRTGRGRSTCRGSPRAPSPSP